MHQWLITTFCIETRGCQKEEEKQGKSMSEERQEGGIQRLLPKNGRRLILFPLPFQGHITPMLQLANILFSKGFSITIIHTQFNSPNPSNHPHFTWKPIYDGLSEILISTPDVSILPTLLTNCLDPFRNSLNQLLTHSIVINEPIACLIADAVWDFAQTVVDEFNLPRLVLRTSSLSSFLVDSQLPLFLEKGYFNITGSELETSVPEFPFLKFKDIIKIIRRNPKALSETIIKMNKENRASSGLIWNVCQELEDPAALATVSQYFPIIPHFFVGPFHKYFPASSSCSLFDPDQTCIPWLDSKPLNSVIYISFGSGSLIDPAEFLEMAMGLVNSNRPFLWVVRPGSVVGSTWLEVLSDGVLEKLNQRGHIVKWAPQQEVLNHSAIGCFWTHNGWNSTLESICEGVPIICFPRSVDQPINARYASDVWRVGVEIENGFEREGVKRAIRRLMEDKEGMEIREKIVCLKEMVNGCVEKGGSSYFSLESLVDYILSF